MQGARRAGHAQRGRAARGWSELDCELADEGARREPRWSNCSCDRYDLAATREDLGNSMEILFCVDADGVVRALFDVDVDAVLQEPKLLEPLDLLKLSRRQRCKSSQRLL